MIIYSPSTMPLAAPDYRRTLDFLNYPYDELSDLKRFLDGKAIEHGEEWVTELQDLLDTIEPLSIAVETEKAKPTVKSIEIAGEQTVEYESSALVAAYSTYNNARAKLCRLTGLSIAPSETKIIR